MTGYIPQRWPPGRRRRGRWCVAIAAVLSFTSAWVHCATDVTRSATALEEVVVTARKVSENAQAVPASLQVLSRDELDAADLTRLYELQFSVPGLVVNNIGLFGARFSMRGVTDEGGGSLAVANHLNGAYLGTANLALARLFDMQRVEILKGPQGTLYGRNATGGSINFITRPPEDEFQVALEGGYGSYHTARVQGHVNLPLEHAALRLAFIGSDGDGYIRNTFDQRRFGESDFYGVRASLRFEPTEALSLDLMAQHVSDDGATGEVWTPNLDFLPDPGDIRLTTVTHENPLLITDNGVATANLEYDLAPGTLYSVTGFARNKVRNVDDCAGMPILAGCVRGVDPARHRQWSQELRLASREAEAPVDWLLGAYYFDARATSRFHFTAPGLNPDPINDFVAKSEETAYALFGSLGYRLNDRWRVSGGLRFGREDYRVSDVGSGVQDNPQQTTAEDHRDNDSWRIGLEYAATADVLVYSSVATGFKSGGITTERLPSGEFNGFGPEDLLAYELGVKAQSSAGRWTLNAAAFRYQFEDMQVLTTLILGNRLVSAVDNAARAEIYGLDVAGTWRLNDRLTLSAGAVWMPKREFVEFRSAVTDEDVSGNHISRAPRWSTAASVAVLQPIRGFGTVNVVLQHTYRSRFFFTKENVPDQSQRGFGLWNLNLEFEPLSERWYLFASARNFTDTDYFNQAFIQSSPGYPDTYEVGAGVRF